MFMEDAFIGKGDGKVVPVLKSYATKTSCA